MRIQFKWFLKYLVEIILLALVYHLAARLGLKMAYLQANTSPVWPPSGIALAALLLLGIRRWPGITIGVVAGSLLTAAPLPLALGLGLANTLEALAGAWILKRLVGFHITIDRIRDVIGLAGAAALSTAVSATLGVLVLSLLKFISLSEFFTVWITWWLGNFLGVMVITPFILAWSKVRLSIKKKSTLVEGIIFLVLLVIVIFYVFETSGGTSVFHQALVYVIFPFAIWAALRLELTGAVSTVFIVSGIAIWGTIHGTGPFSRLPLNDSLILLQTFTGVVALTSLTLAASSAERRHAEFALTRRVEDLAALNDASREFLGNLDQHNLYEAICRLAVERLGLAAAWIEIAPPAASESITSMQSEAMYQSGTSNLTELSPDHPAVRKITQSARQTGQISISTITGGNSIPGSNLKPEKKLSAAAIPLVYAGNVTGILGVLTDAEGAFPRDQILLLESYANLAVAAVQNTWLFDQVRLGNEQLHALSHRLMNLQERERIQLSRELHDETGQILSGLMVRLGLLERDANSPDLITGHISELKGIAAGVLNNLHNLAVALRPASLDHLGLITALEQYIQEYMRQYPLKVQFDAVEIAGSRLPPEIETALYRIVQESLTNVALHASASRVDILINKRSGCLVMTVEDDGVGFDPIPARDENRLGLFGMRERVEMLGGTFLVESSPGKGTIIVVEVPYAG